MADVTVEDLANMALGILVEAPIASLDEDTKAARLLNLHYETTRQAELQKHAWSFAVFRQEITSDPAAQAGTAFTLAYALPDDALRVLPLTDNGEASGRSIPWRQEGRTVLTSAYSPLLIRYIGNMTDPGDWNSLFVEAFAARLAMKIAMPLTNKTSVLQGAQAVYNDAIAEARRINAIETGAPYAVEQWTEARGDYSDYR